MKNFFKVFGLIALAAVVAFSMAGCGKNDCGTCEGDCYYMPNSFSANKVCEGKGCAAYKASQNFTGNNTKCDCN